MYCLVNGCWYGREMLGRKSKEKKSQNFCGRGQGEGWKEGQSRRKTNPQHSVNNADVRKA